MAIDRAELSRKVAEHSGYKIEFVRDVIDALIDVMVAEIANTGDFKMRNIFSISSSPVRGYKSGIAEVKPYQRLNVRLSSQVKTLFKFSQESGISISPDSWIDVFRALEEMESREKDSNSSSGKSSTFSNDTESKNVDPFMSDLLEDD